MKTYNKVFKRALPKKPHLWERYPQAVLADRNTTPPTSTQSSVEFSAAAVGIGCAPLASSLPRRCSCNASEYKWQSYGDCRIGRRQSTTNTMWSMCTWWVRLYEYGTRYLHLVMCVSSKLHRSEGRKWWVRPYEYDTRHLHRILCVFCKIFTRSICARARSAHTSAVLSIAFCHIAEIAFSQRFGDFHKKHLFWGIRQNFEGVVSPASR